MHSWQYSQVANWSVDLKDHLFTVNVGSLQKPERCVFTTPQVEELAAIYEIYSKNATEPAAKSKTRTSSSTNIRRRAF